MELTYGSGCSGIEAASVAWESLGWKPVWFSEIEPFPSAVLAHHYPAVPNLGDMTRIGDQIRIGDEAAPDVWVAGTPCQAFSVAGARAGLSDSRGQLTLEYVRIANEIDLARRESNEHECICLWENVPGVLSSRDNAFGCFLGALAGEDCELQPPGKRWPDAGCVYGPQRAIAWRILDAQYFGLAQRRRRVFVVASARPGFHPAQVLFERESLRRDSPPSRGPKTGVAGTLAGGARKNGGYSTDDLPCVAAPLTTNPYGDHESRESLLVAGTLQAGGKAAGSATLQDAESGLLLAFGGGANCQATDVSTALSAHPGGTRMDAETETFVVHGTQDPDVSQGLAHALGRNQGQENAVLAFSCKDHGADAGHIAPTLRAMGHGESHANAGGQVAVCVTGDVAHTLKAEGFDASEDGTGRGQPIVAAFAENSRAEVRLEAGDGSISGSLSSGGGKPGQSYPVAMVGAGVRRLIPRECERLQGFPDDYTLIPWRGRPARECPDGPRYKAIGNSKAVTVVRWIGRRIEAALQNPWDNDL